MGTTNLLIKREEMLSLANVTSMFNCNSNYKEQTEEEVIYICVLLLIINHSSICPNAGFML
jgi:hypothetical protein